MVQMCNKYFFFLIDWDTNHREESARGVFFYAWLKLIFRRLQRGRFQVVSNNIQMEKSKRVFWLYYIQYCLEIVEKIIYLLYPGLERKVSMSKSNNATISRNICSTSWINSSSQIRWTCSSCQITVWTLSNSRTSSIWLNLSTVPMSSLQEDLLHWAYFRPKVSDTY